MGGPFTRINHSGGSPGADAAWRDIGAEFGVETRSYRPYDNPQHNDPTSIVLGQQQLSEADALILAADAQLRAGFQAMPEQQQNYIRRNWFQVQHAQGVYAVGRIRRFRVAAASRREESGLGVDCVAGGSQWALVMAAQRRLPIYVFDDEEGCVECTQKWHRFDHPTGRLVALSTPQDQAAGQFDGQPPPLPREFAGIGTRSLAAAGRQAIRQLLEATYRSGQS